MIEQCKKCALYNSLGCPYNLELAEKIPDCDEFRPREEDETEEKPFVFDYGVVVYKHRFSFKRSLNDYEETTLNKCIRMGVVYKYKTMGCDKLIAEMQIIYKDENDKLHCLCEDLHDYTFEIKHKGDMQISL